MAAISGSGVDADVAAAIAASHLRDLPPETIEELTRDASRLHVPAGSTIHRAGDTTPHLEIVVEGLIRLFLTAPDGRTLTIRYCRPGALIGGVSLFIPGFALPVTIQALVDSDLFTIRPAAIIGLAERDLAVARAMIVELSERVIGFAAEIPGNAFATVRQRVARHLLDLASEHQQGPVLIARISQQDLADSVGTAREVVSRILRDLRSEGIVETHRDAIVISAPRLLLAELSPLTP